MKLAALLLLAGCSSATDFADVDSGGLGTGGGVTIVVATGGQSTGGERATGGSSSTGGSATGGQSETPKATGGAMPTGGTSSASTRDCGQNASGISSGQGFDYVVCGSSMLRANCAHCVYLCTTTQALMCLDGATCKAVPCYQ